MKTLFELCTPRESVFDLSKREDVLDLTDLIENKINPHEFFEENFLTDGMKTLFDAAFKRFHRQGATGVIKLTQAMGGGKTHNMIALGLLAQHPEIREKILGDKFKNSYLGKIKVVAFTGRESDAPYGIWGAIAEQLGKKDMFKDYYSPLQAPGQTAWINLLKGEPLLILLDELPPYLEYAKSKSIGDSNLAVVTITALANLFNALGKEELSNVCLVISDLRATYESGSELLQSSFKELENEVNRSALNIDPVSSTSDEIYKILRKRLFKDINANDDINEIANEYKKAVNEARQMGYTSMSADQIYLGIKDSYPFHPSIKDLFARFKENPGFQQTRGLIRLMRVVVSQLYSGDKPKAKYKYLINAYDFDLNDQEMMSTITQIKPSLVNAISHDISSNGKAIAEVVDAQMNETSMQDLSKLVLVASLADIPNALLGLSLNEIIGYMCEPNRDITQIKRALDDFVTSAWYLYTDRDGRLFFKNTKNIIAEMNSLVESYDNELAKKELRVFLEEKFKPIIKDCYQKALVFPPIDEIRLSKEEVLLVLFEPNAMGSGLQKELLDFYENETYKNRIMFLSGQRNTMDNLIRVAKEHKAIYSIINRMIDDDKVPENDPQFIKANEKKDKIELQLLEAARETFVTLYYPARDGLRSADLLMNFDSNDYNVEKQIKNVLLEKGKFTEDVTSDIFRKKIETRLFTQKEMRWADIEERAAKITEWQWHIPGALESFKDEMLKKGIWRQSGGYIVKGPFPKEKTNVIVKQVSRNDDTGEVTLKLIPQYGDEIHYEIGGKATASSQIVEKKDMNEFKTKEIKLSFVCIDTTGEHETGDPIEWTNEITIKREIIDLGDKKKVILKAVPDVPIRYTTDGSDPKENGGIYDGEIIVPDGTTYVLAVAEANGIYSQLEQIKIDKDIKPFTVDKVKPLRLYRRQKTNDKLETYRELDLAKKHNAEMRNIAITFSKLDSNSDKDFLDVQIGQSIKSSADDVEALIDMIQEKFMNTGKVNLSLEYSEVIFNSGQDFLDWLEDKNMSLKEIKEQEIIQ
ncbi:MAG: hypothetical protein PWQ23_756 [Thermoanaerobacter sp.]|nr:hypothetical protein [Thermoanaerobacter sp.]